MHYRCSEENIATEKHLGLKPLVFFNKDENNRWDLEQLSDMPVNILIRIIVLYNGKTTYIRVYSSIKRVRL